MENKYETRNTVSEGSMTKRVIMILFGVIEFMLGFRFIFRLMGANPGNVFVNIIYGFTQPIVGIFEGIFSQASTGGAETEAVFEPATLIAMAVIGLIAWGVMKLMSQSTTNAVRRTETSNDRSVQQNTNNATRNNEVSGNRPVQQNTNNPVRNNEVTGNRPDQQNTTNDVSNPNVNDDQTNQPR